MTNAALYIIGSIVVLLIILNVIATYVVFNTYFEVKNRRLYQTVFIWLFPFIGSLMAIYLNREDYFAQKRNRQIGNHPDITDAAARIYYVAANHRGGR
jgi:hypothetical protein